MIKKVVAKKAPPPKASAPAVPTAPAVPAAPAAPVAGVDHTKASSVRVLALLRDAQNKLACDPSAVGPLLQQAIAELTS